MGECMKVGHSYNKDCAECLQIKNVKLKDAYRLVSSVEANTEIENVKLKTENKELKK